MHKKPRYISYKGRSDSLMFLLFLIVIKLNVSHLCTEGTEGRKVTASPPLARREGRDMICSCQSDAAIFLLSGPSCHKFKFGGDTLNCIMII